jgi:hypothetical protein
LELIAQKVAERTGIPVHKKDIERIIQSFMTNPDFWYIVYLSSQPFNAVAETIKVMKEEGFVLEDKQGKLFLSEEGKKLADKYSIKPRLDFSCKVCGRKGISLEKLKELLQKFKEIVQTRPPAIIDYDQGYVTPETTISRIALLADRGDIQGKDIIILGDDDLVSIAAALSGLPKRVVILEIDERITNFIKKVSKERNLEIEAVQFDLRKKLPDEFLGKFDTFLTDPPETVEAFEAFVGRGLATLKGGGCTGYFGLTYSESSYPKWNEFQKILVEKFKVVITDIIHDFNEYVNWDYLLPSIRDDLSFVQKKPSFNWYRSSQYRIITLENFLRWNEEMTGEEFYVDKDALTYSRRREDVE